MFNFLHLTGNTFAPHLMVIDFIFSIIESIEDVLKGLIDTERFINWASDYFIDLPYFAQLGALVLLGIIVILGTFALIKAVAKIVIVLAILIAIGILFQQGVFGG